MDRSAVLVVDEDAWTRRDLARHLETNALRVIEASDLAEARQRVENEAPGVVVLPARIRDESGIEFLAELRDAHPDIDRVLVVDPRDSEKVRAAVNRARVAWMLPQPCDTEALDEMLGALSLRPERETARPKSPLRSRFPDIIGDSAPMRELLELVSKVAETDSTALVTGETGTGKELIGRAIHEASHRRDRVFCAVNSAAFPETLLESELFGHRRGAFTGASSNAKGLFEHAHEGTVFLDEVAEMPLSMQAKLLRFLQTGEIRPVGGEAVRYVDVRLVTATNKDLEEEVAAGRFREDLYYRLAVIPVHLPALRERIEDVPLLAHHFLSRIRPRTQRPVQAISDEALAALRGHHWPGNVRELENVIERAVALSRGERIEREDLPETIRNPRRDVPAPGLQSLPGVERRHILETLERVGWNRKQAAEVLQISTTTLWRRLKEFGIDGDPRRGGSQRATMVG